MDPPLDSFPRLPVHLSFPRSSTELLHFSWIRPWIAFPDCLSIYPSLDPPLNSSTSHGSAPGGLAAHASASPSGGRWCVCVQPQPAPPRLHACLSAWPLCRPHGSAPHSLLSLSSLFRLWPGLVWFGV